MNKRLLRGSLQLPLDDRNWVIQPWPPTHTRKALRQGRLKAEPNGRGGRWLPRYGRSACTRRHSVLPSVSKRQPHPGAWIGRLNAEYGVETKRERASDLQTEAGC